jgi:hypothetical protein
MIAAKNALIAWNAVREECRRIRSHPTPPGAVAIGPLLEDSAQMDWTTPYYCTGGAAYVGRRTLKGLPQRMHVMQDFYMLTYTYGIDPCIVHRAMLEIEEYQTIIKEMGCGPAPDEPGHDPDVCYGRVVSSRSDMKVFRAHGALHVWPAPS